DVENLGSISVQGVAIENEPDPFSRTAPRAKPGASNSAPFNERDPLVQVPSTTPVPEVSRRIGEKNGRENEPDPLPSASTINPAPFTNSSYRHRNAAFDAIT